MVPNVGIGTTAPNGKLDISGGNLNLREKGISTSGTTSYDSESVFFRGTTWDGSASVAQDMVIFNDAYPAGQALRIQDPNTGNGIAIFNSELLITNTASRIRSSSTTVPLRLNGQISTAGNPAVELGGGYGPSLSILAVGATPANQVSVLGSITGGGVTVGATGTDANINLLLAPKGSGNVGVGTTTPSEKLHVNGGNLRVVAGQAYVSPQTSAVASPLAFDTDGGNLMTWTTNDANPVININNMKPGGSYMLIVRGTGTGAPTINCWSGVATGAITLSALPALNTRTANASIYNVLTDGSYCYVTWTSGFP